MNVIRHCLKRQDFESKFSGHLVADFSQSLRDRTHQNLVAMARNPHKVVVDLVNAVRVAFDLGPGEISPQKGDGAFLHPLNGVVSSAEF